MIYRNIKGIKIPALGFGTSRLLGEICTNAVSQAIEIGYRHIDTAIRYENETEVGAGIKKSGISRKDIFITTKIWPTDYAPEKVRHSINRSLERLQVDYVDLLLIHWPSKDQPLNETLKAFEEQRDQGKARAIGVSNFNAAMLNEAIHTHGANLLCNQVEYHPFLSQQTILKILRQNNIMLTAYLPIAQGAVFESETLKEIGSRYGKSAAQVSLRWLMQQDNVAAIPRSSKLENMRSNFEIFDFELTEAEMQDIFALASGRRYVNPDLSPQWDVD